MSRTTSVALLALLALAAPPARAGAATILSWAFDDPHQVVGPNDTVAMTATLTNNQSTPLDGSTLLNFTSNEGTLWGAGNPYGLQFGDGALSLFDIFDGVTIDPGESFAFTFGILTPLPGPVAPGTYTSAFTFLEFGAAGSSDEHTGPGNNPFTLTVVPEPATLGLLVLMAGAASYTRRRKRATRSPAPGYRTPVGSRKR